MNKTEKIEENRLKVAAVTGASGFIGSHLVSYLFNRGYRVRALIHQRGISQAVETFRGSLLDGQAMRKFLDGSDTLFHLASAMGNRPIQADDFFKINRDGSANLLEAASSTAVRKVIYFSSAGVYGSSSSDTPRRECDPLLPQDSYELSKLEGEKIALTFSPALDLSILRPGWVYGPGDRRTFKLIQRINSGRFFRVGSGRVKHSPIYIDDLIRATQAAARGGAPGEIYNIGGEAITVAAMVNTIAAILEREILPLRVPLSVLYPPAYIMEKIFSRFGGEAPLTRSKLAFFNRGKPLDSSKIQEELDWRETTEFNSGMTKAIQWYRNQGWL